MSALNYFEEKSHCMGMLYVYTAIAGKGRDFDKGKTEEEAAKLIRMLTQKTAGQSDRAGAGGAISFEEWDTTLLNLLHYAIALYEKRKNGQTI